MNDITKQIATVIDQTNQVEVEVNQILSKCLVPVSKDYGFLRTTLFHNLCLGFGVKVKLLQRIVDYWKWKDIKLDCLHKLLSLRNSFAHTPTSKKMFIFYFDHETGDPLSTQIESVVDRQKGSHWKEMKRSEAFGVFNEYLRDSLSVLGELKIRIDETLND